MALVELLLIGALLYAANQNMNKETTQIILYHSTGTEAFKLSEATKILENSNFNNTKQTVLYIHGYCENQYSESVLTILSAYRSRYDYNILTLDWKEDAYGNYLNNALAKMKNVAEAVAKKLIDMNNAGLQIENLHLVGHSMGGQMAGRIGRELKTKSNNELVLKRITALDPSFNGFYGPFRRHISKNDAEFVDIIHTDAWDYGAPSSSGHADFWVNGGVKLQPGCPGGRFKPWSAEALCSHWRSWRFWAESVAQSTQYGFNAISAESWDSFKAGEVDEPNGVVMGNDCPTDIEGDYYLQTNAQGPFARGFKGVVYSNEIDSSMDVIGENTSSEA